MQPSVNGSATFLALPEQQREAASEPELGDYLAVLRRRAVTVMVVAVLVAAAGMAYVYVQPTTYEASARVLVRPLTTDPLEALGPASRLVDIQTERQIAASSVVAHEVAAERNGLTSDELLEDLSVVASEDSHVLMVTYTATDPDRAAVTANAVAEAYLDERRSSAEQAVAASRAAIEERLIALNEELTEVNEALPAADDENSPALAAAQSRRAVLESQIALVANDLSTTTTTMVEPGRILHAATVPAHPAGMGLGGSAVVAAMTGLIVGVAVAFVRERLDGRLRDEAQVERLAVGGVLGTVPIGRRAFVGRRRNTDRGLRLLASTLTEGGWAEPGTTLAVTVPMDEDQRSATAFGLAAALAERGSVLLVDGDPLTNAIAGRAGLHGAEGLAQACAQPSAAHRYVRRLREYGDLAVLPAGEGDKQAPAGDVAAVLAELGDRWDTIVIDAPPVLSSELGLLYPRLATRTLLLARLGHTSASSLAEAQRRLLRSGLSAPNVVVLGATEPPARQPFRSRTGEPRKRHSPRVMARQA